MDKSPASGPSVKAEEYRKAKETMQTFRFRDEGSVG